MLQKQLEPNYLKKKSLHIFFITAFLFFSVYSSAQSYVYLDENNQEISLKEFKKKCGSSHLYDCLTYTKDNVVLSQVLYAYQFGKISSQEYEQLRKLINKDAGINIQPNQMIVVKKYDSIFSYEREVELHKKHIKHYQAVKVEVDSVNKIYPKKRKLLLKPHDWNKEIFDNIVTNWTNNVNSCIKKYEDKFNLKIVFFHMDKKSLEKEYKDFNWLKDRGIINDIFFKYAKLHHTLILKPDGEYFLSGGHFKTHYYKRLLRNKDWSRYKRDYEKSLNGDYPNGKGMFRFDYSDHSHNYCF